MAVLKLFLSLSTLKMRVMFFKDRGQAEVPA
jgi:hypothetical protein